MPNPSAPSLPPVLRTAPLPAQRGEPPRRVVRITVTSPRPQPGPAADDEPRACGWFDSSWALRQGLAVQECDSDDAAALAACWFPALALGLATTAERARAC